MKRIFSKHLQRMSRGQSLVEIGLTMVIVLTLLAGAVDFGSAFFDYISLRDAAQEGALYGSIAPVIDANNNGIYDTGDSYNIAKITERVRQSSSQPIDLTVTSGPNKVDVSPTFNGTPCAGNSITVTVSYAYQISMPFIGAILGKQTIQLSANMTDTILWPQCP
jgi:Flp pilus assembly protein TadG